LLRRYTILAHKEIALIYIERELNPKRRKGSLEGRIGSLVGIMDSWGHKFTGRIENSFYKVLHGNATLKDLKLEIEKIEA